MDSPDLIGSFHSSHLQCLHIPKELAVLVSWSRASSTPSVDVLYHYSEGHHP